MKRIAQVAFLTLALASIPAFSHGDEDSHGGHSSHSDMIGRPGELAKVSRTVKVDMSDAMRFAPSNIVVKRGETIRFLVKNNGTQKHEMVLGSITKLKEHAELMRKFPAMEHADPNQVAVDPDKVGELIWQFTKSGKVDFACLLPGHFEAGMKGTVVVK